MTAAHTIKMTEMTEQVTATPLTDNFIEALNEKEQAAISLLSIGEAHSPKDVVQKITDCVEQLLSEEQTPEALREYALQLGALWGSMVAREYGWQWQYLDFDGEVQGIYLVSPQSLYCCPPLYFLNKILSGANAGLDGENDNTVMLLFNMMDNIEQQIPPKKYQMIA